MWHKGDDKPRSEKQVRCNVVCVCRNCVAEANDIMLSIV